MSSSAILGTATGGSRKSLFGRLDAMPHPNVVFEISGTHVGAARWGRDISHLIAFAAEPLPEGAIAPSATTHPNIANRDAVHDALRSVLSRVSARGQTAALLLPDPVIRVFILPFETFPRRVEEAIPLLRWRLKKSLPFDADEAVISFMKQASRENKIEIVAAVARQKIVREYESLLEEEGVHPGVVQSSTLASLPLLDDCRMTLLARLSGRNLTTVIAGGENLHVYRSTELGFEPDGLRAQVILDEIFPALAYYQDNWGGRVEDLRVAGFGEGEESIREALAREVGCSADVLARAGEHSADARSLVAQGLEAIVGWQLNRGA